MAAERSGGNELAQLMADHILGDIYGHMTAAVMDRDGVADEGGENGGGSGPGLEDFLFASFIQLFDALEEFGRDKRAFLNASAHFSSSLLRVSTLEDILVGAVLGLAGLEAHCRLAPRGHRTGMSNRRFAFAAAVRVVVRVHDGAADGRADAHVTGTPAGTTIEAVGVLEEHGFRSAVIDAMKACVDVAKGM